MEHLWMSISDRTPKVSQNVVSNKSMYLLLFYFVTFAAVFWPKILTLYAPTLQNGVKHTKTICRLLPTKCLSVFDHFVGLLLKGLKHVSISKIFKCSILYPLKTADTLFFIRTSTFVWGWLFFFCFVFSFLRLKCS